MSSRYWSGLIQLSQVTIPVEAEDALDADKSRISLNKLHDRCRNRICQKTFCPIHGEVDKNEIVMGFEHRPGQFAVPDPWKLKHLRPGDRNIVDIDIFVSPRAINPICFSGQSYYLRPHRKWEQKAYQALQQAMIEEDVWSLAEAVIFNTDRFVVLRPVDRLFVHYPATVRPTTKFEATLNAGPISEHALSVAKSWIGERRPDYPHLEEYRSPYHERLTALIADTIEKDEPAPHKAPVKKRRLG